MYQAASYNMTTYLNKSTEYEQRTFNYNLIIKKFSRHKWNVELQKKTFRLVCSAELYTGACGCGYDTWFRPNRYKQVFKWSSQVQGTPTGPCVFINCQVLNDSTECFAVIWCLRCPLIGYTQVPNGYVTLDNTRTILSHTHFTLI